MEMVKEDITSYAHKKDGSFTGAITEGKMRENDGTMVTVVCISYKHENYIRDALNSFLMQKTSFKYKVFVGEDYGPDHTADIIREYAEKYPDIIVPFLREENMGAQRNLIDLCQHATSPYIAFCEGDDYWIDEYKLQKQFDYMEANKHIPVCGTKTQIDAPKNWHLRSWYKEKNGKLLIPDSNPEIRKVKEQYTAGEYINNNILQTSTYFFRWNYDLEIPEWYYKGLIGDTPLLLLQLGLDKVGVLPDITSVYRINEESAFFDNDRDSNFLRTRVEYIRYMEGLREYALEHFPGYPIVTLENRIKREVSNYLSTLVKLDKKEEIAAFFAEYPDAGKLSLIAFLSFYNDSQVMTNTLTWEGYKLVVRNRNYRNLLRPYVKWIKMYGRLKNKIKTKTNKTKSVKNKIKGKLRIKGRNLLSFLAYWYFTFGSKEKDIWCFSSFRKKGYMDNTKYLYEWIVEHHPEIKAYWLTCDNNVFCRLEEEGKPVLKYRTSECISVLRRAAVVFTDHFVMSDYEAVSGFNDKTKVVQLWHGVGLKAIGGLENTDVPGVMFSTDILPQRGDSFGKRLLKKISYFRHAYYRELFERYFMLVCPGEERIKQIAEKWHIPRSCCFITGHPRNQYLHTSTADRRKKILYAPTYRWRAKDEVEMINNLIDSFKLIEQTMEVIDGEFVIRLHPHTWRNYSGKINAALVEYQHIRYDHESDIYMTLGSYSIMISDYSSIAYDFVLLDRPIVFYCPDLEQFMADECTLNYDYMEYSPGPKTRNWRETMEAVYEYSHNPWRDQGWRHKIRDEFYDMAMNDENNSERIVREVKRRLKMEK